MGGEDEAAAGEAGQSERDPDGGVGEAGQAPRQVQDDDGHVAREVEGEAPGEQEMDEPVERRGRVGRRALLGGATARPGEGGRGGSGAVVHGE